MSKDGVPVLYHDRTLARITDRRKRISDYTLKELQTWDWGGWYSAAYRGEALLTLEQALHLYVGRTRLFIEIKSRKRDRRTGRSHALTRRVLAIVRGAVPEKAPEDIHILSFDPEVLGLAREALPGWRYVLNVETPPPATEGHGLHDGTLYGICMPVRNLEKDFVETAHAGGLKVMTYACNVPRQVNKALDLKVDVILTDKPGWLVETFRKRGVR